MIDLTFRNTNRLFVILFKIGNDDPSRNYFDQYYTSLAEIKDFNASFDNEPSIDQPVKDK